MAPTRRRMWALGLQLLGAALLVLSAFLPWYSVQLTGPLTPDSFTATFAFGGVQTQSTGIFGESASNFLTFGSYPLPATGTLYGAVLALVVVGATFAGGAVLLAARRSTPRLRRLAAVLGAVACVAAAAAPVALAVVQPGTICHDSRYFSPPLGSPPVANTTYAAPSCVWEFDLGTGVWAGGFGDGPQISFIGHDGGADGNYAWGPAVGWFLPLGAAVLLGVGAVVRVRDELAGAAMGPGSV